MNIAVAMSGGVDSSVAALLLKTEGHDIIGVTLRFAVTGKDGETVLTSEKNIKDAKAVAEKIGIEHKVIDGRENLMEHVIRPFCFDYLAGRTPSPCIHCNPLVKFDLLVKFAIEHGYDKVATGHYAKISKTSDERYFISCGDDQQKDQSYFLSMLKQDQLKKILFPLNTYSKDKIRAIAKEHDLPVAEKDDSQEICFIPDQLYAAFIEKVTGIHPKRGPIVNNMGQVLGQHKGIHNYTIGQRRGLGIAAPKPLYVIQIDAEKNAVIAGFKEELDTHGLLMTNINYMKEPAINGLEVLAKTRSTQNPVPATVETTNEGTTILFDSPQHGISPGQATVLYNKEGDILAAGITHKAV